MAVAVAHGSSNAELAGELFVSGATVNSQISHILDKLGFNNRPTDSDGPRSLDPTVVIRCDEEADAGPGHPAGTGPDRHRCKSSSDSGAGGSRVATGATSSNSADCPTTNTTSFATTEFVLRSGLAFGAFHRYLYRPYRAGTFSKGADGRVTAFVKGGAATLFIEREVRLASEDVAANPTLCKAIAEPLAKAGDTVAAAFAEVKGGNASGIDGVNSAISSIASSSSKNGVDITEDDNPDIGG